MEFKADVPWVISSGSSNFPKLMRFFLKFCHNERPKKDFIHTGLPKMCLYRFFSQLFHQR